MILGGIFLVSGIVGLDLHRPDPGAAKPVKISLKIRLAKIAAVALVLAGAILLMFGIIDMFAV